jgi:hypothetical protein
MSAATQALDGRAGGDPQDGVHERDRVPAPCAVRGAPRQSSQIK